MILYSTSVESATPTFRGKSKEGIPFFQVSIKRKNIIGDTEESYVNDFADASQDVKDKLLASHKQKCLKETVPAKAIE